MLTVLDSAFYEGLEPGTGPLYAVCTSRYWTYVKKSVGFGSLERMQFQTCYFQDIVNLLCVYGQITNLSIKDEIDSVHYITLPKCCW